MTLPELRPLELNLHHEIEQFLYREARLLDGEQVGEWLDKMVDLDIRYRLVIREERMRRDKGSRASEVIPFNDDHAGLAFRVRQVESGLRTMLDPPERLRRYIANIETYQGGAEGEYRVHSYGLVTRNRRLSEREQIEYGREDVLRRGADGFLKLLSRNIEIDARTLQAKNLLFFL